MTQNLPPMPVVQIRIDDLEEIHGILEELWSEKPYRNPVIASDDFLWCAARLRVLICTLLDIPPAPNDVSWTAQRPKLHVTK